MFLTHNSLQKSKYCLREQYLKWLQLPCGKSVTTAPNSWKKLTGCALEKTMASDPDLLSLELWLTLRSATFSEVISSSQPDNRSLFKKKIKKKKLELLTCWPFKYCFLGSVWAMLLFPLPSFCLFALLDTFLLSVMQQYNWRGKMRYCHSTQHTQETTQVQQFGENKSEK